MIEIPGSTKGTTRIRIGGSKVAEIQHVVVSAARSTERISFEKGSYTNKVLINFEGEPLFGEIAIVRMGRAAGWEGVWLDTYHGQKMWREMPHMGEPSAVPAKHQHLFDRIAARHGRKGGPWDVFLWRRDEVAFLESKTPGDTIGENQVGWLSAALAEGLPPTAFALVQWSLAGQSSRSAAASIGSKPSPGSIRTGGAGRLPTAADFERSLPREYQRKLNSMDFSPAMDNTLRRIRIVARTYPSRVRPAQGRGLVNDQADALTPKAEELLDYLDRWLDEGYPESLLA